MASTQVLVRVQAKGGKFIGPDAGFSRVTVRDVKTGKTLAQGTAAGESGQLLPNFTPEATRQAIVTPSGNTDNLLWLSASPAQATAGFVAAFDLAEPTLVEITAESLDDGKPNGHATTQTMTIPPGADLTTEPGVVLVVPGLIVKDVQVFHGNGAIEVQAWVSMMCGCKIDPTLPWHPDEFTVTATVLDPNGKPVPDTPATLVYVATSTFASGAQIPLPGPGTYTITVNAVQLAEGNTGSASTTVQVG